MKAKTQEMRNIRILIVENERLVAEDLKRSLENLGYSVSAIVSEGKKALRKVEEQRPDLVLMDIVLDGEMNGIETAQKIRRRWNLPIIYITAYSDARTVEAAKVTEPYGYILKPIDEKELHITVELSLYKHASQRKLKERQERLSHFIDPATDTFCLLDSNFHVIEMNETGLTNWGIKKSDLRRKSLFELILKVPDQEKEDWQRKLSETIASGMSFSKNAVKVSAKGEERILNVKASKAADGIGLIITDVSTQFKIEQALRRSEDRYRMLVESMNDGIAMIDQKGIVSYVNEKFLRAQGYTPQEVIGRSFAEFVDENGVKIIEQQIARQKRGGHDAYEIFLRKKNGGKAATMVSPTPVFEQGKFRGSIAVLTDISERRQVEEELSRSREQLRNLSRHLQLIREEESKRIAREIHDELGQALTAMKMDLSWLTARVPEDLADRRAIIEKTRAMSSLIDRTIQIVQKISAELRPGLLDDLGLIPAIEWQAQEFQNRTAIRCEMDLDAEPLELDSERSTAIFRVFQEALTNVARHSQASQITIKLKKAAGKLELRVSDNGIGIPEKAVSAADSLGLMGMRERLLPFGGELKISRASEKGTTLAVFVPLKDMRKE